jgi:uncharacterized membrane protein
LLTIALMPLKKPWLLYALITTVFWGIWGAFIEIPEKAGFPATLGYVAWAITMIPCAIVALYNIEWKLETDTRSILLGCAVGLTGAGGQLILFQALREGPAYIIFPMVSLFPILSIFLSIFFLRERATRRQWTGIAIALIAIFCLSWQQSAAKDTNGNMWLILSVMVFILWGIQAYAMKFSNNSMKAESIFFYMMITAVALAPVAIAMTDFSIPVNYGFKGPYLAAMIHLLNAVGALTLVYAMRYGKAIIVVPVTGLSPLITIVISLILYRIVPGAVLCAGVLFAGLGMYLLSE